MNRAEQGAFAGALLQVARCGTRGRATAALKLEHGAFRVLWDSPVTVPAMNVSYCSHVSVHFGS